MQLSQLALEPHSLCCTCWVQVVYSLLPTLLFFLLFSLGIPYCCSVPGDAEEFTGATRSTRTSRRSSPSRRPCGALLSFGEFYRILYFASAVSDIFVIKVINNICISFYYVLFMICAVIYCSFCCIYVWLDPVTYMIARFMSFYKPGVTEWYQSHIDCRTKPR